MFDLFRNSLHVFLIRAFGAAASFFVTIAVTNASDSESAGVILLGLSLVFFWGQFNTLGSQNLILKNVGSMHELKPHLVDSIFSKLIKLCITFSLIFCFFLNIYFYVFEISSAYSKLKDVFIYLSLSIFFYTFIQLYCSGLQGLQKTKYSSFIQNVSSPFIFIILIVFYTFDSERLSVEYAIKFFFIASCISFFLCIKAWYSGGRKFVFNTKSVKIDYSSSLFPLFIFMIMTLFIQYIGHFVISFYLPPSDLAYFVAAQRTSMLVSFILIAVNLVLAPRIAKFFYSDDLYKVDSLSKQSSLLMLGVAAPVLLLMIIFSELIMSFFGNDFVEASSILVILALGQFVNVATGSVGYLLSLTNNERDLKNSALAAGLITTSLCFLLTPILGLYGVALSVVLGSAVQNLLGVYFVKIRLGFNTLNLARKIQSSPKN